MSEWTKEDVYDEQIAPLMTQIIAICQGHRIPMAAQFNYARDENGPCLCTTVLPAKPFDRDDGGQIHRMYKAARPEPEFAAFTVFTPKKEGT